MQIEWAGFDELDGLVFTINSLCTDKKCKERERMIQVYFAKYVSCFLKQSTKINDPIYIGWVSLEQEG